MNNIILLPLSAVIVLSALLVWIESRGRKRQAITGTAAAIIALAGIAIAILTMLPAADCSRPSFREHEKWKCTIEERTNPVMTTDSISNDTSLHR